MNGLFESAVGARTSAWAHRGFYAILAAVLLVVPAVVHNGYDIGRFRLGLVYILAALGLNIAFGFAGEFTLSHAVVMAASAYGSGLVSVQLHASFGVALASGLISGVLVALILALPSVRVRGAYLGLITLFAVLAIPSVVTLIPGTGSDYGLSVPSPVLLGGLSQDATTYELIALATLVVLMATRNLIISSWGTRLKMMRESQRAAEAVGLNPFLIRAWAYVLFAIPVAFAGVIITFGNQYVTDGFFNINLTLLVLTGVILGGKGRLWGPVVGTVPLIILNFYIGPFSSVNPIVFGLTLVVAVIVFPNGIVPVISDFVRGRFSLRPPEGEPAPHEECADAEGQFKFNGIGTVIESRDMRKLTDHEEKILEIVGIRKAFGGVVALDDLSLTVDGGHIVGIMGQNGSGKSTLLNIINGFYRPDAGAVRVSGVDIAGLPTYKRAKLGVGRTFQVPRLIDGATVAENIGAGLLPYDRPRLFGSLIGLPVVGREERARRDQIEEMASLVGIPSSILDDSVDMVPLGLKRIVEVARAAVARPRLLLLDEPGAGLNNEERAHLGSVLIALCKRGVTPIVVEHNVEFVMSTCEQIVLMESGKVACEFFSRRNEEIPYALDQYLRYSPL